MTTFIAERRVATPAGPHQRPGWGPLFVMLIGTFMTFLSRRGAVARLGALWLVRSAEREHVSVDFEPKRKVAVRPSLVRVGLVVD